jgi:hypothetical protein
MLTDLIEEFLIARRYSMKIGIPVLILGILLLLVSIPFSLMLIIGGVDRLVVGDVSGGILAYAGIAGVVLGFVLTTIGATKVFKD